jgi:D-lactate dehydrogenase (cytochrome)
MASSMAMQAIALGGTCTGEHGVGVGKKAYLRAELGDGTVDLMALIKTTVDPHNLMNPGKVVDINDADTCRQH